MKDIAQISYETIRDSKDWDIFRNYYRQGKFDFRLLQKFNVLVYPFCTDVPRFDAVSIGLGIQKIIDKCKFDIVNVLELGAGKGCLASDLLPHFQEIIDWQGVDINPWMIKKNICNHENYGLYILKRDFWDIPSFKNFDILITSHTLEHFTAQEVEKIFNMGFKSMVVEVPLKNQDYYWKNGGSSHVLDKGWVWFCGKAQQYGYKIVFERQKPFNKVGVFIK